MAIKPRVLILDSDLDVLNLLAATFKLKNYEVFKAVSAEECMNILAAEASRFDAMVINGQIAEDRGAMVIVHTKNLNPDVKILAIADADNAKTRILDYGADEFTLRPMSTENVADKVFNLIAIGKKARRS